MKIRAWVTSDRFRKQRWLLNDVFTTTETPNGCLLVQHSQIALLYISCKLAVAVCLNPGQPLTVFGTQQLRLQNINTGQQRSPRLLLLITVSEGKSDFLISKD